MALCKVLVDWVMPDEWDNETRKHAYRRSTKARAFRSEVPVCGDANATAGAGRKWKGTTGQKKCDLCRKKVKEANDSFAQAQVSLF